MDQNELMLLAKFAPENPELQSLWEEHTLLKKQLEKIESKPFLIPQEEEQVKLLKKEKLDTKTTLLSKLEALKDQ